MRLKYLRYAALLPLSMIASPAYQLVTPQASCETQSLADYLESIYGKKILSGQMDDAYVQRILQVSGKEPAIVGYDLDGVTPSQGYRNRDAAKAISWVRERGGIAQFSWHWIRPDGLGDYYSLGFDLRGALSNPQSANYQAIIRDIDLAANELKKLQDAHVPVLWRPLHEAEGGWFWWGAHGKEALQQLWRLMYDRMTNHHGLRNLIWVWTSYVGDPNRQDWYPGDDVVDLIVYDYPDHNSWNAFNRRFGNSGKMFGIGENGRIPDPGQFQAASWLYFLTWAYMINPPGIDRGQNDDEWIRYVFNHETVITLDELPDYRQCPSPLPKKLEDNQALKQPVTTSSTDMASNAARYAVDGNLTTRWSSAYTDSQWIAIELQDTLPVQRVILYWETAFASSYRIQVSNDWKHWITVYEQNNGQGGRETVSFVPVEAKYLRVQGIKRATPWGISLYEVEIYCYPEPTTHISRKKHKISFSHAYSLSAHYRLNGQRIRLK